MRRITGVRLLSIAPVIACAITAADATTAYLTDRGEPNESSPLVERVDIPGIITGSLVFDTVDPWDIALDLEHGTMYWVDSAGLRRANLDGTNVMTLDTQASSKGVDVAPQHVYWVLASGDIVRAGLDGTNVELVIAADTEWVALDLVNDKVYWSNAQTIRRSDLDGSNRETVLVSGTSVGSIAVDPINGKLYWAETAGIHRANLDGTDKQLIHDDGVFVIDLDRPAGYIYYTFSGTCLGRVTVDGANPEVLLCGAPTNKRGLAIKSDGVDVPATSPVLSILLIVTLLIATSIFRSHSQG